MLIAGGAGMGCWACIPDASSSDNCGKASCCGMYVAGGPKLFAGVCSIK